MNITKYALSLVACAAVFVAATPTSFAQTKNSANQSATKAKPDDGSTSTAAKKAAAAEAKPAEELEVDPLDWPNWRGPRQNSTSPETGIVVKWDPKGGEGSNVVWTNDDLGGISTPSILNGKLYTIVRADRDTRTEGEKVVCVDANTGKKIWENRFNVYLSDVPAERIGWSSVVCDPKTGRVYAQGVSGYFLCMDGETGETIWSRSLHEEFGLLSTYGGRTNVPVIFEDMVITSAVIIGWGERARPAHSFLAMDKATGEIRWYTGTRPLPDDTTYSTPFLGVLGGQAAMVFASGDGGLWAFQPRTGKAIWNYQLSRRGVNMSPVVADDVVYASQAEENIDSTKMGAVVAIDGTGMGDITESGAKWRKLGIMAGKPSPLLVNGRLYIVEDGAKIHTFDAKTGEPIGRPVKLLGTIARATPLYVDGKIYVCSTSGYHVLEPTEDGLKIVHRMRLPHEDEVMGSPIVSHGKLYIPTGSRIICLADPDVKAGEPVELPEQPKEDELTDKEPAQVQIVPCEVLLSSGEKQQFTVRTFNARGQFLEESKAEFTLQGPGKVNDAGVYTAAKGDAHTATILTAKVGELSGEARIRVVPPLPWKFTFNDIQLSQPKGPNAPKVEEGEPPITWVGARYRHKIRDLDGERVMVKVTTIPKGTRSQSWMGPIELHDYTIQADVRGAIEDRQIPDIGLIAQRYTLDMMGESQQLQIRSWPPQVATNFSKTIPFAWKPDTWYTMKFSASVEDGKAVLRGKVWPREESEPSGWTIEATHDVPNVMGSPGLFGNATNAEIYIDNILVTPNDGSVAKAEPSTRAASK